MNFEPELGQMMFRPGTWEEYAVPEFVTALLEYVIEDIGRVYGNRFQKRWDEYEDPQIPGVEYRTYWWGEEDAPEADLPNFAFGGVELRWYKHPGRSMSANREMDAGEWASWFQECLAQVRAVDTEWC